MKGLIRYGLLGLTLTLFGVLLIHLPDQHACGIVAESTKLMSL